MDGMSWGGVSQASALHATIDKEFDAMDIA
jgi:hypothetical protein